MHDVPSSIVGEQSVRAPIVQGLAWREMNGRDGEVPFVHNSSGIQSGTLLLLERYFLQQGSMYEFIVSCTRCCWLIEQDLQRYGDHGVRALDALVELINKQ
jgi:hypothetical protein